MHLFCMSICISGYASIYLDIHLFCRSAYLLFSLVCSLVWQCIWQCIRQSGCLAYRSICISGNLAIWLCIHLHLLASVCHSVLPFYSAILFCHSVLPFCSASLFCRMCICCLPERISTVVRMPALLLEHLAAILPVCRHICTNVCPGGWISACLVARLSVWRSARSLVCSSGCIWQRVWSHINLPGNLSAHSAATGSIWQLFHSSAGSIICRPRFRRFICHSGRPWRFICQIWQAVEVHLPNLAGRGPFRSSNPSAIQAGCRPFRPKRGPIRPINI